MAFAERRLREGIDRIPEAEKVVVTLAFFEHLDDEQIARQLGSTALEIARLRRNALGRLRGISPVGSKEARSLERAAEMALRTRFAELCGSPIDEAGRVADINAAFVPTAPSEARVTSIVDVCQGDGGELRMPTRGTRTTAPRFNSARSSCALPVNAFGPWRLDPAKLILDGMDGFTSLRFERRCPIHGVPSDRTPPNLDVLIDGTTLVGIESKLIEHITAESTASLSTTYDAPLLALADEVWRHAFERLRESPNEFQSFGAAQIVKHYLGLKSQFPDRVAVLVYLFWEPLDADDHRFFALHRAEIAEFATWVSGGDIAFRWLSYRALFDEWRSKHAPPWLKSHVAHLNARYGVAVTPFLAGTSPESGYLTLASRAATRRSPE